MSPSARVAVLATLDTKLVEARYLADRIAEHGCTPVFVDLSLAGEAAGIDPGITRREIADASGWTTEPAERTEAMQRAVAGARALLTPRTASGEIAGAVAIGGGTGGWMAGQILGALPIGFPKLIVTTVVKSDGRADTLMLPSVVDIAGLNRVLVPILANAAGAICGMVRAPQAPPTGAARTIAMTMFGVTTAGGDLVRAALEEAGCEVVVFHATGAGGATMEDLARQGLFDGILDWTTSEVTDEIAGGICTSGPGRLDVLAETAVPYLAVPGAVDVINVLAPIPDRFAGRTHHMHLPTVPLIRTSAEESASVGRFLAGKLAAATGPAAVLVPDGGYSALDIDGGVFRDSAADDAFVQAVTAGAPGTVPVHRDPNHINDEAFARRAAQLMLDLVARASAPAPASHPTGKENP